MLASPFIPGHKYNRRRDIHAQYGGNWQSGICPSSNFPYIFIFTGSTGHQHGYEDGWDNPNVFTYTGEGQQGDMEFTRGNLALREHLSQGKRVFLFAALGGGMVEYISELEFFDVGYFETPDRLGNRRQGIKFFFKRAGVYLPVEADKLRLASDIPQEFNYAIKLPNVTERSGLVTSRVGQGAYRKRIIHRWEYQCAVTGFDKLEVLIASHIVPWKDASDDERLDVDNGLLLSPNYDALFDRHLISFEGNGSIILSDKIETVAYQKIGITGKERLRRDLNDGVVNYLQRHTSQMFGEV
jgi:hypothetical protein